MKGNLLDSKATDLNVNHIQKVPPEQHLDWENLWVTYLSLDQTIGYHGLAKLTHKVIITVTF